jgi:hypothetical protein
MIPQMKKGANDSFFTGSNYPAAFAAILISRFRWVRLG